MLVIGQYSHATWSASRWQIRCYTTRFFDGTPSGRRRPSVGSTLSRCRIETSVTANKPVLVAHDATQRAELGREVVAVERLLTAVTGRARDVPIATALLTRRHPTHPLSTRHNAYFFTSHLSQLTIMCRLSTCLFHLETPNVCQEISQFQFVNSIIFVIFETHDDKL